MESPDLIDRLAERLTGVPVEVAFDASAVVARLPQELDMLSASEFETFAADGYVVTPAVFSAVEILAIHEECERLRTRSRSWAVLGAARESSRLLAFAKHDVFRRICAMTIGSDADLFFDGILHKPAHGGKELRWHQDAAYGRTDSSYVACWVPLTAGSAASGGLCVSPGSHRAGPLEHTRCSETAREYAGLVSTMTPPLSRPLDLSPGQVAVIHSELLHRSGPNATDVDRLAYQCGFVGASTRFLDDGLSEDHKLPIFRSPSNGTEVSRGTSSRRTHRADNRLTQGCGATGA